MLSFNQIANSDMIREGFKHHPDGIDIPRSPQTVRDKFMQEFGLVFQGICKQIDKLKQGGAKFSLTLDDWSFPGQSSLRDFLIKSNCVILCTA